MEYRYFYPISAATFASQWQRRTDLENRVDIYFLLPSSTRTAQSDQYHLEHGLKLRNRKKLELKERQQRLANGQEYWIKTILSYKSFRPEETDALVKALRKSDENELLERLMSVQPIILCYVNKYRHQRSVGGDLIQEFTGLHLTFRRSNDQTQIGDDLFFETVCIEQGSKAVIDQKMIDKVLQEHGHTSVDPMGYPEFLFRQYQLIRTQQ